MHENKRYEKISSSRYEGFYEEQRRRIIANSEYKIEREDSRNDLVSRNGNKCRKWLVFITGCFLLSIFVVNAFTYERIKSIDSNGRANSNEVSDDNHEKRSSRTTSNVSGFVVSTSGCRIPSIELTEKEFKRFFAPDKPIRCEAGSHRPLVNSNLTSIYIVNETRSFYYTEDETPVCCYRPFRRSLDNDNGIAYDDDCSSFNDSIRIVRDEFVKIECTRNGSLIYEDYHAFVPRKSSVEERCRERMLIVNEEKKEITKNYKNKRLSLLVMGIDAVSRLNFHRTMPKTVKILRDLGAVEMMGYNKVGDNTFPNLVPVLTGLSVEELTKDCWKDSKKANFDDCPFLWNKFTRAGYRTVFAEDACHMGIFNYLKSGFKKSPTDYYLRPYCLAIEKGIGNTRKLNADLCVGTRLTFENLLDYCDKVARVFANDSYFGFFWQASLTHDFVTYPRFGDDSYFSFFRRGFEDRIFDNTAIVLMSDHGIRWGSYRQTYQGRLEESLPFVFVMMPEWWRKSYPSAWTNLKNNAERSLTTPYDLHETFRDALNIERLNEEEIRERTDKMTIDTIPRGISWFLPLPDYRTCPMAGISGHWCTCRSSRNLSIEHPMTRRAVRYLVRDLNRVLNDYPRCSPLSLATIIDAKIWDNGSTGTTRTRNDESTTIDYTITIETKPGGAIFEATVRRYETDDRIELVGTVSRLNLYGEQSSCVDDFKIRLYCYCLP